MFYLYPLSLLCDEDGILLLEVNRMLRAGGYFVWAAQPVYKHEEVLEEQWQGITILLYTFLFELFVELLLIICLLLFSLVRFLFYIGCPLYTQFLENNITFCLSTSKSILYPPSCNLQFSFDCDSYLFNFIAPED